MERLTGEQYKTVKEIQRQKRIDSFKNTEAWLMKDGSIILNHATDADFQTSREYLEAKLDDDGATVFAKDFGYSSVEELLAELLDGLSDEYLDMMIADQLEPEVL